MRQSLVVLFTTLTIATCNAQSDFVILQDQKTIDELITIFKILPKAARATTLSQAEFTLAKEMAIQCITEYNKNIKENFKKRGEKGKYARMYQIKSLDSYRVQFVAYINENGEKEIWMNGFCNSFDKDWRKEIIQVFDGGNSYFRIRLNLSTGKCISIGTNGYA